MKKLPIEIFTLIAILWTGLANARAEVGFDPKLYQALEWRSVGPHRGGRVVAVAGHADKPLTYYMGATGGGVWKTTNGGQSWSNISDGYFNTTTIGGIAVAPSDPNIVYVGTGETPIRGVTTSHGDGVYKSVDGGKTWTNVGLKDTRQISKVVVHPTNPDIIYVAAQGSPWAGTEARGIYRSRDGGDSWERTLFVNPTTGASFLTLDPNNPDVLYAGMWDHQREPWTIRSGGPGSGLYKTNDGGDSWRPINNGLPKLLGNTAAAVSPADSSRVYAMIEATEGGVFRSDDGGESWQRINGDAGIRDRGWYYTHIFADPTDADRVYVLASSMVRSDDGGKTFTEIRTPHGDNHDLWINPGNHQWMVQGNDGGANVSYDGGVTWSRQDRQPTAQFYRVITDNMFPYRLYAGQQDNSSVRIPSRTFDSGIGQQDWRSVGGGESAHFAFDADNPRLVYGTSLLGTITEYDDKWQRAKVIEAYPYFSGFRPGRELEYRYNWNAPVVVSAHDPKVIYHGANAVLRSTDRGQSWQAISPDLTRNDPAKQGTTGGPIQIEGAGGEHYNTLMYIAESTRSADEVWTGADDGMVYLTRNGGKKWRDVTPKDMPEAQVNMIELSPHDPATAYLAVTRYKFNDFTPMIYATDNYGRSWRRLDKGLPPDAFVRVVREDPTRRGLLYAGTESGMFVSFDNGQNWQSLQLNLPVVPITDLRVKAGDLVASTQGRAFWILDDISPLQQLSPATAQADMHLFAPRDTYRVSGGGFANKPGKNPPNGVVFRYALNTIPGAPLELLIEDEAGNVIRRFSSEAKSDETVSLVKGVQGEPPAAPLGVQAGMNQYVWNLRHARMVSVSDTIRYVSNRPHRVAPGVYRATLSSGPQSVTQSFAVKAAPWAADVTQAQWAEQQSLLRTFYDLVNDVHETTNATRAILASVQARVDDAKDHDHAAEIATVGNRVIGALLAWQEHVPQAELPNNVQDRVAFPSRLLSTQILHVMRIADQDPPVSAGVRRRATELVAEWAELKNELQAIRNNELKAFNDALVKSGVAGPVAAIH